MPFFQIFLEAIVGSISLRSFEPGVRTFLTEKTLREEARATSFPGFLILPPPPPPLGRATGGKMRNPGNKVGARASFPNSDWQSSLL